MKYRVYKLDSSIIDKYCSKKCYAEHQKERLIIQCKKNSNESKEILSQKAKERFKNKENHPMYGRHHSEQTKEKISKNHIETGCVSGENNGMFGKNHTKESCEKMSDTRSKRWIEGKYDTIWCKGKYFSTKMNKEFIYRSSWELGYMKYMDTNTNIQIYECEKIRLPYRDHDNHLRYYIPDFIIQYKNARKEMLEKKCKK